jgi:hypothetical protein
MRHTWVRIVAACAVAALVLMSSSASAKGPKPITGKLSKRGYTVIALDSDGRASSVLAKKGKFKLRSPAKRMTLHLRQPDGDYGGPIVVGRKGKQVIVGVKAGASLGKVAVRKGYGKAKKAPERSIDRNRTARAKKGVPIGARRVGRVLSRKAKGPSDDRDLDGVPVSLDIDDDGDLILDAVDRSGFGGARAAQDEDQFFNGASLTPPRAVNVNAGSKDPEIDSALPASGFIGVSILSGSAELDCGRSPNPSPPPPLIGLSYCSPGGTGRVGLPGTGGPKFPECCDSDHDGVGTLVPDPTLNPPAMFLAHGADSTHLTPDDTLIEKYLLNGQPTELSATVGFVFATVPALVSYSDTGGTPPTAITYPFSNAPLEVRASGEDVVVTLSFWRPQRRRDAADPPGGGAWLDIGGLQYTATNNDGIRCPETTFSNPTATPGPNLTPTSAIKHGPTGGGFQDNAPDQPAAAGSPNRVGYTLNLTQCLASKGLSFGVGETRSFAFLALPPNLNATAIQSILFTRVS